MTMPIAPQDQGLVLSAQQRVADLLKALGPPTFPARNSWNAWGSVLQGTLLFQSVGIAALFLSRMGSYSDVASIL
jgi:hypothetical protein